MASVTGFVIAAPGVAFSARGVLGAPLRFDTLFVVLRLRDTFARFEAVFVARDALFVVLRLRDAFARFEAVFVARDALFATVRPRALPPPTLARDLDAVDFAGLLLRSEADFLEVAVFFFLRIAVFFAAGRPRALTPPRDLEAVVLDDLAIHNSFELDWDSTCGRRVSSLIETSGQRRTSKHCANRAFAEPSTERATCGAASRLRWMLALPRQVSAGNTQPVSWLSV
jgi:hypothetical protein